MWNSKFELDFPEDYFSGTLHVYVVAFILAVEKPFGNAVSCQNVLFTQNLSQL